LNCHESRIAHSPAITRNIRFDKTNISLQGFFNTRTTEPVKMTDFETSFKIYSNLWISISEISHDFYYNIWRIKLSICLPLSSPFFKVIYALYLYTLDQLFWLNCRSSINRAGCPIL